MDAKKLLAFGLIIFGIIGMTNTVSAGIDSITLVSPSDKDWTSDTTPSFVFSATSSSRQFNCTLIIDSASYGTNNTVQNNTATTMTANATLSAGSHTWYVNCSDTRNSSVSASRTLYIYSSNLVTSWYTTNGSETEIAYPNPHSVLVNRTVNFYITLNSSKFSNGWNATIEGWNGANWVPVTFMDPGSDGNPSNGGDSSNTQANITIRKTQFEAAGVVLSNTTNWTMRILLSNKSSAYVQILKVGVWSDMYVIYTSVDTMTVGSTTRLYFNVTDWRGTLVHTYMNYTPSSIINESLSSGSGYDIEVFSDPTYNFRDMTPKYAGNLTLFIVTSSGVNIREMLSSILEFNTNILLNRTNDEINRKYSEYTRKIWDIVKDVLLEKGFEYNELSNETESIVLILFNYISEFLASYLLCTELNFAPACIKFENYYIFATFDKIQRCKTNYFNFVNASA